jgi:hypothetical protein
MTNYKAYLKGKAFGIGPSKQELKLRAARCSGDPKKIEEALNQLRMWLAREPGAGSGERGAGIKRAGSRDCRKKSRNR